jgi:sterol desaturase/sphingolipid hydroxylase (fatty acid hydroxylase superfamily)
METDLHKSLHPYGISAAWFIALFAMESIAPLRLLTRPRINRVATNLLFSAIAALAGSVAVRPAGLGMALWTSTRHVGLLHMVHMPAPVNFAIGFLLMDLSFYYWHRANHTIGLLWRFHNAHHIDPDLDVSTSFRFHFVEILYSAFFRIAQVAFIGVSPALYITYELFFGLETMFHHSNIKLPLELERVLNWIIVTPRMHGIHHSFFADETNSNYSVIFSFWDRLHGTVHLNVPHSKIRIGVPAYSNDEDNSLLKIIMMPFLKQRNYWQLNDAEFITREDTDKAEKNRMIL